MHNFEHFCMRLKHLVENFGVFKNVCAIKNMFGNVFGGSEACLRYEILFERGEQFSLLSRTLFQHPIQNPQGPRNDPTYFALTQLQGYQDIFRIHTRGVIFIDPPKCNCFAPEVFSDPPLPPGRNTSSFSARDFSEISIPPLTRA